MANRIQNMIWKLFQYKANAILLWGLSNGSIGLYSDALIEKLRGIYDGGLPASILLLSNGMSNGHCYDRSTLLSRAFLDEDGDVQLVYASVDSLRLNPDYIKEGGEGYADHCFVERTTIDGRHIIFDTSSGLMFDKRVYWMMERPKVRAIRTKEEIRKFIETEEYYYPEDIESSKYASSMILPMIELTYGRQNEIYTRLGRNILEREIEHFKEVIDYDSVCREIDEDMRRMGIRK